MATLGETLGPDFTGEVQAAWRAAYEEFARRMAAAASSGWTTSDRAARVFSQTQYE